MKTAQTTSQDVNAMKLQLMELILSEENTSTLKELGDVLERNRIVAHTVDGRPLNREDYVREIEKGLVDVAEGRTFSSEEVKEKMKLWSRK
jgi:predicted transcriptional regulator